MENSYRSMHILLTFLLFYTIQTYPTLYTKRRHLLNCLPQREMLNTSGVSDECIKLFTSSRISGTNMLVKSGKKVFLPH